MVAATYIEEGIVIWW